MANAHIWHHLALIRKKVASFTLTESLRFHNAGDYSYVGGKYSSNAHVPRGITFQRT